MFRAIIQGMHTLLDREIVRLMLFTNFLKYDYIHYTFLEKESNTGVPVEKPSKLRRDQLRELHSHYLYSTPDLAYIFP